MGLARVVETRELSFDTIDGAIKTGGLETYLGHEVEGNVCLERGRVGGPGVWEEAVVYEGHQSRFVHGNRSAWVVFR